MSIDEGRTGRIRHTAKTSMYSRPSQGKNEKPIFKRGKEYNASSFQHENDDLNFDLQVQNQVMKYTIMFLQDEIKDKKKTKTKKPTK